MQPQGGSDDSSRSMESDDNKLANRVESKDVDDKSVDDNTQPRATHTDSSHEGDDACHPSHGPQGDGRSNRSVGQATQRDWAIFDLTAKKYVPIGPRGDHFERDPVRFFRTLIWNNWSADDDIVMLPMRGHEHIVANCEQDAIWPCPSEDAADSSASDDDDLYSIEWTESHSSGTESWNSTGSGSPLSRSYHSSSESLCSSGQDAIDGRP